MLAWTIYLALWVLFCGFWMWLWYCDRAKRRRIKLEHLISISHTLNFESLGRRLREAGISPQEFAQAMTAMNYKVIGDIACRNNARSPYIRCAVNPSGPCKNCQSYEPI